MQQARPTVTTETPVWLDRLMRGIIFGGGAFVFIALAWVHLGLGALLFPPAPSAAEQTATAGMYHITLSATSGQLTADGLNTLTLTVRDSAGHMLTGATLQASGEMATMAMFAPAVTATVAANGSYVIHPIFGMAGIWNMTVVLAQAGQPDQHATFQVSVRWH
jgi:hypothetical protein